MTSVYKQQKQQQRPHTHYCTSTPHNTMANSTITPVSKEAAEALVPLFEFERMLNQGKLFLFFLTYI